MPPSGVSYQSMGLQPPQEYMFGGYSTVGSLPDFGSVGAIPGVAPPGRGRRSTAATPPHHLVVPPEAFDGGTLDDLHGRTLGLARDQYGCRFLQKKMEEKGSESLVSLVFEEVYDHIAELMTDPFGNYLCQKLIEVCTEAQRSAIIHRIAPDLVHISLNLHGTRAVQKLIEYLTTESQVMTLMNAIRKHVVPLIKDLNGNHVVQRCLHHLSSPHRQFIYDAVVGRCVEVATHRHGCCVLQRCIDYADEEQRVALVHEITMHALELVQDPFGNYVVQYILDLGNEKISEDIMSRFAGHVCDLSVNKFSSNVIEKCFRMASMSLRSSFVTELVDPSRLPHLLQDSFANYVVQTALSVSDSSQFRLLSDAIRPLLHLVRNTPYGKKIETKLNRRPSGSGGGGGGGMHGMSPRADRGVPGRRLMSSAHCRLTGDSSAGSCEFGGGSPSSSSSAGYSSSLSSRSLSASTPLEGVDMR